VSEQGGSSGSSWTGERLALRANGLVAEQVLEIQRARIVGAMVEVVLELGVGEVSVAQVVQRAGVSRRTFYEIFTDREDCFLAALDDAVERIAAVVVPAYEGDGSARGTQATQRAHTRGARGGWRERIRAAITELLGLFEEDPGLGRFAVVESLAAGPRALALRNRVLDRLIAAVDEGRTQGGAGSEPSALTAEGVVGAVGSILYARLATPNGGGAGAVPVAGDSRAGKNDRALSVEGGALKGTSTLVELTSPLMGMIVLPYLGKAAAAKELARPVPAARASVQRSGGGYPFRELGMRLTYRTLRVLDAVACNPGASNRLVGDAAGVGDQGQISKLLARLARLGLIENTPGASGQGLSNAWALSEEGERVARSIRMNTKERKRGEL
jgi:AcrR family transcriptional regulator/DNA-binding MarR family transcriptional regulator